MYHIERKIMEYATAHSELVDDHNENEEEIAAFKSRLADLSEII